MGAWFRGLAGAAVMVVLWVSTAAGAMAQDVGKRVALIIGNSTYASVGVLPNPVNDAGAVAESFSRIGFDVTRLENLTLSGMRTALQDFESKVIGSEIAVVYYAGHGMEMGGQNYLIPVDARLSRDTHVVDEAVPLSRVLAAVQAATKLRVVLLDACRNNPFASQMQSTGATRAVSRGLARIEPVGGGTLIAYAAAEGTTADDGDASHSPFTSALLASVEEPGLEVRLLFGRVRDEVMNLTGGAQEPFVYNSLGGTPIYLLPPAAVTPPPQANPNAVVPQINVDNVAAAYTAALGIGTIDAWDAFLRYHDNGFYADLARAARAKLDPPLIIGAVPPANNQQNNQAQNDPGARCDALAAFEYDPQRPASVPGVTSAALKRNISEAETVCRQAVQAYPGVARYLFQLGHIYDVAGDYAQAAPLFRQAADKGSYQGMNDLGVLFQLGHGVAQDYTQARTLYQQAVVGNASDAMANLGNLYDQGLGVAEDLVESGRWYERGAALGNADAIAGLGYRYDNGRGVPQDQPQARSWYEKAALRGSTFAMNNLAYMFDWGIGGGADLTIARHWYGKAAELGNEFAMNNLGYAYENGRGVTQDYAQARAWYERAAAEGNAFAMTNLGALYANGRGVAQDYGQAFGWYSKAAELDNADAMKALGDHYYFARGVAQDFGQALGWYGKAAELANIDAMNALGDHYYNGNGVAQDFGQAFAWYQKAADGGNLEAMTSLGNMYDNGQGVAQNFDLARQWYEHAANQGHGNAIHNLGYLYEVGHGVSIDTNRAAQFYLQALAMRNPATVSEFRDHPDSYSVEIRQSVQQFLIDRGYLDGAADGNITDRSRNALSAWLRGQ